jgi:hypothetical protein
LTLDGLPRASYSFSIQAADTLFAGLTSSCSECTINIPATISLTITNQSFNTVDPDSTTVIITTPSGSKQPLTMTRISTGDYQSIYTPDTEGTYLLHADLTKANDQVIPTDMTFFVTQQSTLSSIVNGDVFLHTASPITVTVTNELSVPIDGASVSISNETESLHGTTDSTGKINLNLMPESLTAYTLTVEKPGFESANDQIPVQSAPDTTPPAIVVNIPALTNQNPITVNGQTEPGAQVTIAGTPVTVDDQGIFSATLTLSKGENEVHASTKDAAGNIRTADYQVILDTTPPALVVNSPIDKSNVTTETIPVSGKTEVGAVLMVNDIRVDLAKDGSFSTYTLLTPGQNKIKITATDAAGNVSTISRMVNLTPPKAFNKVAPVKGATNQPSNLALSWAASTGASSYEYCLSKASCTAASTWISTGTATSKALSGLTPGAKYYWQVRARNGSGLTYANGSLSAAWSFSVTKNPGAFNKTSPANLATGQLTSPILKWGSSLAATRYDYCYDTTKDNLCNGTWTNTGTATSKTLSGLKPYKTYYWQVRAVNSFGTTYANGGAWWSFKTAPLSATFKSIGSYDGWVLESKAGSGVGKSLDAAGQTLRLGDDALNRQYRDILSFDTTGLPDTAVITQVTFKVMLQSIIGTNPFTSLSALNVDIREPFFGTTVGLVAGDFQASASKTGVGAFGAMPVSGWYTANLGASANPYVNKSGTTQFRLRFATASNKNSVADTINLFSGNATTMADRPVLIIKYYVP